MQRQQQKLDVSLGGTQNARLAHQCLQTEERSLVDCVVAWDVEDNGRLNARVYADVFSLASG